MKVTNLHRKGINHCDITRLLLYIQSEDKNHHPSLQWCIKCTWVQSEIPETVLNIPVSKIVPVNKGSYFITEFIEVINTIKGFQVCPPADAIQFMTNDAQPTQLPDKWMHPSFTLYFLWTRILLVRSRNHFSIMTPPYYACISFLLALL